MGVLYTAARHLLTGSRLSLQSASGSLSLSPASASTALTCAVLLPSCAGYTLGSGIWHKGGVSQRQQSTLQSHPGKSRVGVPRQASPPEAVDEGETPPDADRSQTRQEAETVGSRTAKPLWNTAIGRGLGNDELLCVVRKRHQAWGPVETQRALTELSGRVKAGRLKASQTAASLSVLSQQLVERMQEHSLHTLALSMASLSTLGRLTPELAHQAGCLLQEGVITVSGDPRAAFDISRVSWACARTGCGSPELFAALTPHVKSLAHLFKPSDLSRTAWAYAKCCPQGEAMRSLFDALHSGVEGLNAIDVATAASAVCIAGQVHEQRGLLRALGEHAVRISEQFGPAELSKTLHALCMTGKSDARVFDIMIERAMCMVERFSPKDTAAVVSALGRSGHDHDPLLRMLCKKAARDVQSFSPQDIVELLYGLAKARYAGDGMDELCVAVEKQAGRKEFRPSQLVTLTWAAGQAGRRSMIAELEPQLLGQVQQLNGAQVAQVLWGCAKSGHKSSRLTNTLERRATCLASELTPQDIGNTVWALAKIGHTCKSQLLSNLQPRIAELAPNFTGPALSACLWGYAILNPLQVSVFNSLTSQVEHKVFSLSAAELATAAWACGHAGYLPSRMLDVVTRTLAEKGDSVSTQWLVKATSACANLQHDTPELIQVVGRRALASPGTFTQVELAMVAEAFAAHDYEAAAVFQAVEREVLARGVQKFRTTDLARIVSAMGRVDYDGTPLFRSIVEHVPRTLNQLSKYDLVRLLWAFAETEFEIPGLLTATDCWLAEQAHKKGVRHVSPALRKAFAAHSFSPVLLLQATSSSSCDHRPTSPHSGTAARRDHIAQRKDAANGWHKRISVSEHCMTPQSLYPEEPCAILQCHA